MIIARREDLLLPNENNDNKLESWHHLTIYDEKGEILSRSGRNHMEGAIFHEYDGLIYFSPSRNGDIYISLDSINEKFSNM